MVKLFGTTFQETREAFGKMHLGANQSKATKDDLMKSIARIVITVMLLLIALYLFRTNRDTVGGTIIGAVCGYWLK